MWLISQQPDVYNRSIEYRPHPFISDVPNRILLGTDVGTVGSAGAPAFWKRIQWFNWNMWSSYFSEHRRLLWN